VFTPPLPEQRAIAHILGTLDDKIELNRRMSETLEAMARALFKSWFVDFDPVRAKMEGRDPGLPKALADLFPDRLVDSELGEIPEGWKYLPLGELVELTRGTTYSGNLKDLPGPALLGLASIAKNGGFREEKLSTYGGYSPANLLLAPGELFASLKDVTQSADLLGAVARVPAHVKQGRLTQDTVKLTLKATTTSTQIVYHTLLAPAYREYCRSRATGTTNLGLSRDDFLAYPVVKPSVQVQFVFDEAMRDIDARASNAVAESRTLAALRATLLPKLISGELRVKETHHLCATEEA
jgi:type I restriction enzyme S subunit